MILTALKKTSETYETKVSEVKTTQKVLYSLSWDLEELETLLMIGRQLKVNIDVSIEKLSNKEVDVVRENVASSLASIEAGLSSIVKSLSKYQPTAAIHIWVIMISPEDRRSKPYTLPVQCIPYRNITGVKARQVIDSLIKEMKARSMSVAGTHEIYYCMWYMHLLLQSIIMMYYLYRFSYKWRV